MRICIICPVRKGTPDELFGYVEQLEQEGHIVFFPTRDIKQTSAETAICQRMLMEIDICDEAHVFYDGTSQGVHFDMGLLFGVLSWPIKKPKVVWLNPSENPIGYEAVLKGMVEES